MRWSCGFLFVVMFFSLVACHPASIAPEQMIPTQATFQPLTITPSLTSAVAIPAVEQVFTPTVSKSPILEMPTPEVMKESQMPVRLPLTITILYDNDPSDQRLNTAWGFSALVEVQDHTLLFDTGGEGQLLLDNMHLLGIDIAQISSVVLSHAHDDHTAGLKALLETGVKAPVYLLPSFPPAFKRQIGQFTEINEVTSGQAFADGLFTTGEMGGMIREQALVIRTLQGLVVITGCAHPGIVAIVEQAKALFAEPVCLVLGGFHLEGKSDAEINTILRDFRRLGVEQVAPCHCTGEHAISMFAAEYGDDFLSVGVGSVIGLEE